MLDPLRTFTAPETSGRRCTSSWATRTIRHDAAAAPALQRMAWYEELEPSLDFMRGFDRMRGWRDRLLAEPAVQRSTVDDIRERFAAFVKADGVDREGRPARWLGKRVAARA